jgi:hypothetical protein
LCVCVYPSPIEIGGVPSFATYKRNAHANHLFELFIKDLHRTVRHLKRMCA